MIDSIREDLKVYVRARYPVLYLVSGEEERVARMLRGIGADLQKKVYFWTCSAGFEGASIKDDLLEGPKPMFASPVDFGESSARSAGTKTPAGALDFVLNSAERALFVLQDFHAFLDDPVVVRRLRDVILNLKKSFKTLFLVSPVLKVPEEVERDVTVVDIPLPDEKELQVLLRSFLDSVRADGRITVSDDKDLFERVARAALGLAESQATNVFARAAVNDRKFSAEDLPLILAEKKQVLRKTGILEFFEHAESLTSVGGLDTLKRWLASRKDAFSDRARAYGLPQPKGLLLLGVQGCGKSLSAKAIAATWKLPLLRLDVGSLFSSYIGASEANMRKAILTAEGLAPVVLWLDEIEKGFAGMKGGGNADAGASMRVFSTFLTWMQEKTKPVFVIATANRIADLPPELLRKGRFDEIFFIDLPSAKEREEIFKIHIGKRKRDPAKYDLKGLASAAVDFNGAEVEEAIVAAMYRGFSEEREFAMPDVLGAVKETVPLAATMAEEIAALRQWARGRARQAGG
ncbi:MAG: AAA family ATPase [Planctomycetes bacterium]|nr:AAA family ATPase [Planctomycetota bacterium]